MWRDDDRYRRMLKTADDLCQPLKVLFEITNRCNLDCVHCYLVRHARRGAGRARELSLDEIRDLFRQLADLGTLFLTLSGGEIFLRPDLFHILEAARRHHFWLKLLCTGYHINAEKARQLADLHIGAVGMSLYSAEPGLHDAITRIPGSHARTLRAFEHLRRAGVHAFANCIVMKQNHEAYGRLRKRLETMGIPHRFDTSLRAQDDGRMGPLDFRLDEQELYRFYTRNHLAGKMSMEEMQEADKSSCGVGKSVLAISAFGDIHPCGATKRLVVGNVRDGRVGAILQASRLLASMRTLRKRDHETCAACGVASFCFRCPAMALMEHDDLRAPSTAACQIATVHRRIAQDAGSREQDDQAPRPPGASARDDFTSISDFYILTQEQDRHEPVRCSIGDADERRTGASFQTQAI